MENSIKVFNLGGLPTAPLDSFIELQEDFKKPDADKLSKLQMLIITRGFKYSFKVWKDSEGKLWIIDAHQRRKAFLDFAPMDLRFQRFPMRKSKHLIRRKPSKRLQLIIQSSLRRTQTLSYSPSIISVAMILLNSILAMK